MSINDNLTICTKDIYDNFINGLILSIGPNRLDYFLIEERGSKCSIFTKCYDELPCEKISIFLADWIIDCMEEQIMYEILKNDFLPLLPDNASKIIKKARENEQYYHKIYNKKIIVKKITKWLENIDYIDLEGFVRFCIYEYRCELGILLENALDELREEQEYLSFMELLRQYLGERPSQTGLVHILIHNDCISLYDFSFNQILIETPDSIIKGELKPEDADKVLSALMILLPERIIFHNSGKDNSKLIKLITDVFEKKISICNGCNLCCPE